MTQIDDMTMIITATILCSKCIFCELDDNRKWVGSKAKPCKMKSISILKGSCWTFAEQAIAEISEKSVKSLGRWYLKLRQASI